MSVQLGDKGKDKVSGLVGIVMGRTEYLYGCKHVLLTPQETKDGKSVEGAWYDEDRIEVIECAVLASEKTAERAGGPALGPSQRTQ